MDIDVLEGVQKEFIVRGLELTKYEWGGGAECVGALAADILPVEVTEERVVLRLQPLTPGPVKGWKGEREKWRYQVRAVEKATKRLFVLLEGAATVKEWYGATEADGEDTALGAVETDFVLDGESVGLEVETVLGAQGESGQLQPYITGADVNLAALRPNAVHDLGELAVDTDLSLLTFAPTATSSVLTAELWFTIGSNLLTVMWPTDSVWPDGQPALNPSAAYRFAIRREPTGTLILSCAYEYSL